jgi:RNA polymerase sigma-70 factor (ECF subfamily)
MLEILSDAQLVAKTLENPDNYALIIDRFEEPILRYVGRMTGVSHEEIEELGQIIFIKAYRSLNGFDIRLKLSSWLYRIAHNVCVDYLRKTSKKNTLSLDADDEYSQALIEKISSHENVSLYLSEDAQRQGVREIIHMLPEKYRTVILLFFVEDKSYEEISDILQIPVNTVWTLLSRAKKHFLALAQEPQFSHLFTYA